MSREERRQYQRMMRNMERGPALPPGARARLERKAARRGRGRGGERDLSFGLRFWVRSVLVAAAAGFIGLSLQWSEGLPFALYVGLAVLAVALLLQVGIRLLQRRAARPAA